VTIKTRFAPSPTGFLHIGGARTALFSWAYAKKYAGKFFLRIEDTDIERSTKESVDSILQTMNWLGLNYDGDAYYQTEHMSRYFTIIQQLLLNNQAYHCYCSKHELEQMREEQKAQGLKPKYDRRCLHNPTPKNGNTPVVRFKNPEEGSVVWQDLVKGRIEIRNHELDDLIIARSDGTPTYNLCVVVDDWDMQITHIIRGDDHINNTPRQINILKALGASIPTYAHVPMILREDGQKMSKRTDAVSVMQYKEMGILPEALLNYLARLCWGHGDAEIFTLKQFIEWFNLDSVSASPARFDMKKLYWVNKEHLKNTPNSKLIELIAPVLLQKHASLPSHPHLKDVIELVKTRVDNLNNLATECSYLYFPLTISVEDAQQYLTPTAITILDQFAQSLTPINLWDLDTIKLAIKDFCATHNLKMPSLGMPLRLKLCGTTHTPSFDSIMYLLGKAEVLNRLKI